MTLFQFFKVKRDLLTYVLGKDVNMDRIVLYYEMSLLHPSTDTECIGTQIDKMDKSCPKPIDEHVP